MRIFLEFGKNTSLVKSRYNSVPRRGALVKRSYRFLDTKRTSLYLSASKLSNARICPSLRLGYSMVWQTPMFKNVQILRIEKRYMLNLARRLLYGEQGKIPRNARSFATWNAFTRDLEPKKGKAPEMEIDPVTGYKIMNPIDYSGKNHFLLNQSDIKSETYYVIRGSFTTSYSPFNGKLPIFVSPKTLKGYAGYQFLHVYDEPLLLRVSDAKNLDPTTTYLPPNEELDALIRQYSNAGLDIKNPA